MQANNFLTNVEPRIPTRIKRAMSDLIASFELKAARVASGRPAADGVEAAFSELLEVVKKSQPFKYERLKQNMERPLARYRHTKRFATFRDLDMDRDDALLGVDLVKIHKPIVQPVAASWVDIASHVGGLEDLGGSRTIDRFLPQTEHQGLKFYLHKVKCFDETGSGWGEWGEDEIYCGAVAVDENGQTSSGGLFKVGDFDDGDVRNYGYPGKQLQYFNIHEGGDTFPKIYTLAVSLVEHDFGDLPDWFNKFFNAVKDKVAEYLAGLIGAAVGSYLGPLGALVGAVIGWAVGKLFGLIKSWLEDEVLGYASIRATINGYTGNWVGSGSAMSNLYTRDYRGDSSHYRIYWRCQLV